MGDICPNKWYDIDTYLPVDPKIKGFSVRILYIHHTAVMISFGHELNHIHVSGNVLTLTRDQVMYYSTQWEITIWLPFKFKKRKGLTFHRVLYQNLAARISGSYNYHFI